MIKTQIIIKQLCSPTKINIVCHLMKNPNGLCVTQLVSLTGFNRTNISKQINEMKNKGLLVLKSEGRYIYYKITNDLHPKQNIMIKNMVASFHIVDEGKTSWKN